MASENDSLIHAELVKVNDSLDRIAHAVETLARQADRHFKTVAELDLQAAGQQHTTPAETPPEAGQ